MMEHGYKKFHGHKGRLPQKQKGALTMFSAVLILILLTELIIYAVQVGVFEQRKSANEMRQKEAFHVAESAIQFSKEFLLANSRNASGPDWLATRWKKCSDLKLPVDGKGTHPCYAEPADGGAGFPNNLRNNMYYYSPDDADLRGADDAYGNPTLPIDVDSVIPDSTQRVDVYALLCMLHIERNPAAQVSPPNSPVQGCTMEADLQDPVYFMITLMARGEADCDGGTCSARALITDKVGSFGPIGGEGGPGVPLTTKSTFPPSGTSEIVPNPNGGGVGVPISAWMNSNDSCANQVPVDPTGGPGAPANAMNGTARTPCRTITNARPQTAVVGPMKSDSATLSKAATLWAWTWFRTNHFPVTFGFTCLVCINTYNPKLVRLL